MSIALVQCHIAIRRLPGGPSAERWAATSCLRPEKICIGRSPAEARGMLEFALEGRDPTTGRVVEKAGDT